MFLGFPCGSADKESANNTGDLSLIPWLGKSPREGKGYPLKYSTLENSMECIGHGVAKSRTWLSDFHFGTEGNSFKCWSQDFATVQPSPRTRVTGEERYKSSDAPTLLCSFCSYEVPIEVKVSACNAGDLGSIPVSGRSPGEGNGNPLQYSCLENPRDGGAWWATVHGVAKSQTQLSNFTLLLVFKTFLRSYTDRSLNSTKIQDYVCCLCISW